MTRWQVALPWLILAATMAAPAAAQTQDQARARKHFVLAQAHEKNGDYAEAAVQYVEAYKYFPSPEFFYNAGRAYELGGDAAKAVEHYERYIALDPNGRAVANARVSCAERATCARTSSRRQVRASAMVARALSKLLRGVSYSSPRACPSRS